MLSRRGSSRPERNPVAPIARMTGRPAKTPYATGYELGMDGYCVYGMRYSDSAYNEEYRRGWYHGYHAALTRELDAYNQLHNTAWEPRT